MARTTAKYGCICFLLIWLLFNCWQTLNLKKKENRKGKKRKKKTEKNHVCVKKSFVSDRVVQSTMGPPCIFDYFVNIREKPQHGVFIRKYPLRKYSKKYFLWLRIFFIRKKKIFHKYHLFAFSNSYRKMYHLSEIEKVWEF